MNPFTYYAPTKVVFGAGTEHQVGALVAEQGAAKVLVHYGSGSVVRSGLLDRVLTSLDEAGIAHVELGGVVPNPRLSLVYKGIELCQREGVDFLLAVGGGSVIDSSKAIAYGLAEPEHDVWELYAKKRAPKACLPVGAVLTIAAAGSEMSNSSVITNEELGAKCGCNSDLCRCRFAVMNPELMLTLPWYQTACGCTDIMMHTMERYFTGSGNMRLSDELAEGLLRTVRDSALILRENPDDLDARADVMWASSLSHNGLTGCGNGGNDFATHSLEHELSAAYDVAHGAGLAALWPSWARYVMDGILPRFVRFAVNVMGVDPAGKTDREVALAGVEAIEEFYRAIGMPTNLRELGLEPTDDDIASMAHRCATNVGGSRGSAKRLYEDDMRAIYEMAR